MARVFGDDFLLVLITSLGTTVGWRFSENIIGKWYYNILVVVLLFLLTLFYGIAMAIEMNEVLLLFIEIGTVAFILFYVLENVVIVKELYRRNNSSKSNNSVGYTN